MSKAIHSVFFSRKAAICLCWGWMLLLPAAVFGQTNYYKTSGTEYAIIGTLPGDQVFPDAAVTPAGGFVVWQDNITDGSGWGVSAMQLNGTLSGSGSSFRVNVQGTNDQSNPRVAMLNNGGAVFVWQGGKPSREQIFARFLTPASTWTTTNDVLVNTLSATNVTYSYNVTNITMTITTNWNAHHTQKIYTTNFTTTIATLTATNTATSGGFRINPAVATLTNGNVVVVWASFNQAGQSTLLDVYGQLLTPAGQKVGGEFLVNQFTNYNQRRPTVAALNNGGFVVAWVSEQERVTVSAVDNSFYSTGGATYVSTNEDTIQANLNTNYYVSSSAVPAPSVDIYARLFNSSAVALGNEFLVNSNSNPCGSPAVAAAADGTFMVTWSARDQSNPVTNGWDVYARPFSSAGVGAAVSQVNTTVTGDQHASRISAIGLDYLIVWTSVGQDGSLEGVYGQFVHEDGTPLNGEFLVNTTTLGRQMQPAVASDGAEQFLVVWTGYNAVAYNMDLYAQRYINVNADLSAMDAPFVYAPFTLSNGVYQPQLQVSWPPVQGISISNYEVYVDGTVMASTASNYWTMTALNGLTTNSTHAFRLDYVTTAGARPPLSASASGMTWSGANYYGLPLEWVEQYYGLNVANWPVNVNAPLVPGGPTLYQVFVSGGDPLDSSTWLCSTLAQTSEGLFLSWNTQPGFTYQVQVTTNFSSWNNLGAPRFAAGTSDSIYVGGSSVGYYRILLLRQ
ncbi:MAG: hypothetical protein ABSF60_06545 [Verrucomicrobiota bacterium]